MALLTVLHRFNFAFQVFDGIFLNATYRCLSDRSSTNGFSLLSLQLSHLFFQFLHPAI